MLPCLIRAVGHEAQHHRGVAIMKHASAMRAKALSGSKLPAKCGGWSYLLIRGRIETLPVWFILEREK